jgi:hypothetical protein
MGNVVAIWQCRCDEDIEFPLLWWPERMYDIADDAE